MTETTPRTAAERVARLFDELAPDYDQTGVELFRPVGARLVELLQPRPGERALDIGCGRGAVTFPLARAVGGQGRVTAVDVSPTMVELTRAQALREGLDNIDLHTMDASAPTLPEHGWDVLASSLVLFFLPDPAAALAAWMRLLRPDGRLGVTTFGPQDDVWKAVDGLFADYLPAGLLDARTSGTQGPFADDAGMERLLLDCGARTVSTRTEPVAVTFDGPESWRAFSMSVGQRAMWKQVPEERHPDLFAAASALLEKARTADGRIVLTQQVRYTLGVVG